MESAGIYAVVVTRICACVLVALLAFCGVAGAQDTVIYYHTDGIGSVRMITDANRGVLARYDFEPFGIQCASACGTGTPPETIQFAGKERDTDTTFDYFGARYYDSQTGRFTMVDPGHVSGDIFNPQTWNAYAYALNNPLRFIDPLGTCSQDASGNYNDGDDGGTLVTPGPCPRGKDGALAIGITETVSVKSKPAIVVLAEGIAVGAGPVADPLFIVGFYGASALGGVGVAGAGAIASSGSAIAVTSDVLFGGIGPSMAAAISQASNPRLRNALSALYQVTDRLRGGTAAAVQFTRDTGILVGGSDHVIKASQRIAQLQNILRRETLTPSDRQLAEYALRQLQGALK